MGITDPELIILDEFEDVEYERSNVEVSLLVSAIKIILIVSAHCYKLTTLIAY